MNIDYTLWPNTDGNLGNIKVQIPTGIGDDEWPEGDALVQNFVYKDGKLVGFVDAKALSVNDSKTTIINYDYIDIELPFTEGEIAITRGERSKYFNVRYVVNDEENGNVVVTLKYKGCKTVDDVKAVDPDYLINDIVDDVWTEGLGDMENGNSMFRECTNLTSFSSDLSSLTNGECMFYKTNLTTFTTDLPSLTNGRSTFYYCKNLTSFDSDLSNLSDGWNMFSGCSQLASFSSELSSLTNGYSMFYKCTNLTTFTSDLSSVSDGSNMFRECTNLTTFTSDLSTLTNGSSMFYKCTNLASFTSDLSSVSDGGHMFWGTNLTTFDSDLSSLSDGEAMFYECINLTSFISDLPSLTNGNNMFFYCINLTSFDSDLSSLTNGYGMFNYCENLTSFTSDLPSLTDGYRMFFNCKLDTESVQNIADTINSYSGTILIGIGNSTPNDQETAAFDKIASKGWTVYVNGYQYTPSSAAAIITLDETGQEISTPIPFYAKPVQSDEEHARYVDENGNFFDILGAQFIYGDDLSIYGMFTCEEDAAANMRLTKIEKKI